MFREHRVGRQDEAGSAHFAVVAIAPWEKYIDALQPRFHMTEEQALRAVVPATRLLEESMIDAIQGSAGIATNRRARMVRETTVRGGSGGYEEGGGTNEWSGGENGSGRPGRESQITTELQALGPAFAPSPNVPTRNPVRPDAAREPQNPANGEPSIDPMTRYWAATALFQEVQLLSRYVRDASVRSGYEAFVVRLQVSLMPAARREPYDAYCMLSFFTDGTDGGAVMPLRGAEPRQGAERATPQVVPLLVTDNLEAGMNGRTLDTVRQLAGAVFAMSYLGGASGDLLRTNESLRSVFGQDLNSLLTVGRVSDNTVRVRLGAMQQAESEYAMIPRSHDVTLLLLVPAGAPKTIDVAMRSTFVDAETGAELPQRSDEEVRARLLSIAAKHGLGQATPEGLFGLTGAIQRNDQNSYQDQLVHLVGRSRADSSGPALWVDLAGAIVGSQYSATQFDLPEPAGELRDGVTIAKEQTALLEDDGRDAAKTSISAKGVVNGELSALLCVRKGGEEFTLEPVSFEVDEANARIKLVFPSLVSWGLATQIAGPERLRLMVKTTNLQLQFPVLLRLPPAPAPVPAPAVAPGPGPLPEAPK